MQINLTDVFTSEGKVKKIQIPLESDQVLYMKETYPILRKQELILTLTNTGSGRALLEGAMDLTIVIPCSRCLKTVEHPMHIEFSHPVVSPEQGDDGEDEQFFVSGYELDTEILLKNEILINMPVKVLCREDCKGICPVCGRNRNETECGCDTFVPDPRMAAIKDIFNAANKEV